MPFLNHKIIHNKDTFTCLKASLLNNLFVKTSIVRKVQKFLMRFLDKAFQHYERISKH